MVNDQDYIDLGLACADICRALDRGMDGKRLDDLSRPVREAIALLTMWVNPTVYTLDGSPTELFICRTVAEIQRKVIKYSQRNSVSRLFRARDDRDTIATWRSELDRILHIFNVCSIAFYLVVSNCSLFRPS